MFAKIIISLGSMVSFCLVPVATVTEKVAPPVYRVVLDPGHGGVNVMPVSRYGDRYDKMSKTYLEVFREGSVCGKLEESVQMYKISEKVKMLLSKTETDQGWEEFGRIVQKYTGTEPKRVVIQGYISRKEPHPRAALARLKDPNYGYRLHDYPDGKGGFLPGRVSYINSLKPQLVVSLHCAESTSPEQIGMSAVICPPYSFLHKGLEVLKHTRKDGSFFFSSRYANWFEEKSGRTLYRWFLNDSSLYFLGYPLDNSDSINYSRFKGYRYNTVSWIYADDNGWETTAAKHPAGGHFANTVSGFIPDGPYWDRERSKYEEFRRGDGPEGYGGDNLYASNEIIRYVLTALSSSGFTGKDLRLADPYISVWTVPLYVNAISAYIELGYLKVPTYQKMYNEKLDIVAEGIAVGIYSLLVGTDPKASNNAFRPKGSKLDLEKYTISDTQTYFDAAVK